MGSRKGWRGNNKRYEPAPPRPPDVSSRIGTTDLTNKNVQIYLLKLPSYLAKHFENPEDGIVGRLRIPDGAAHQDTHEDDKDDKDDKDEKKVPTPKIFINKRVTKESSSSQPEAAVTEFDMEYSTSASNMIVFSGSREGENDDMRVEGVVMHQCVAKPRMDEKYRSVNKNRTTAANKKDRFLLTMGERERLAAEREALKPMSMAETAKQREERKRQKEDARRHLDVPDAKWREYTKVAVFKAFEIQSHYTADELAKVVGEPTSRIRPIISEVCSYNKSGPFASRYELKDEFKTASQRQQKERDLEDHRLAQLELLRKRKEEQAEDDEDGMPPAKKARPN